MKIILNTSKVQEKTEETTKTESRETRFDSIAILTEILDKIYLKEKENRKQSTPTDLIEHETKK